LDQEPERVQLVERPVEPAGPELQAVEQEVQLEEPPVQYVGPKVVLLLEAPVPVQQKEVAVMEWKRW
jgi:hypothetical protein